MNKYDELIIKYFDGQLSADDRQKFERELEINKELNDAFENYRVVQDIFSTKEVLPSNQDYFSGIVSRFKQKLDKKASFSPVRKIGFSFATILLIISSYLLFQYYFFNQSATDYTINSISNNLSDEEMNELANYISDDYWNLSSSKEKLQLWDEADFSIDGIIADVSVEEGVMILSDYQINDIYSFADEEQLEIAYNEILTKRIF